jgi:hypothetical protein
MASITRGSSYCEAIPASIIEITMVDHAMNPNSSSVNSGLVSLAPVIDTVDPYAIGRIQIKEDAPLADPEAV